MSAALLACMACGGKSVATIGFGSGAAGVAGMGGSSSGGAGGGAPLVTNSTGVDGLGCEAPAFSEEMWQDAISTACAGTSYECLESGGPVDLHLVLERSGRMLSPLGGISKWEFARRGIEEFLGRARSLHRVGFSLFPKTADDCDASAYELPLQEPAHDDASFRAILERFDSMPPSGSAPTVPALEGALRHVEAIQTGTLVAQRVVLIVAGAPTACDGTVDALRAAFANSLVTSYVIALAPDFDVGPVGDATETWPFVVGEEHSSSRLADALWHIALGASRRACENGREIPEGLAIDRHASRIFYRNEEIPRLENLAQCATSAHGGFYLDETSARPEYDFCPCTCARFTTCEAPELILYCE